MKQFLESLVKSIVENPDAVSIAESQDDQDRQLLTITVDPQDMGRVIGKNGKVINSIRTIMRVVAIRQGVRIRVDIHEEGSDTTMTDDSPDVEEEAVKEPEVAPTIEPELEPEAPVEVASQTLETTQTPSAQDLVQPPQEKTK